MTDDTKSNDALQAEIDQLRARVSELERTVEAQKERENITQTVLDAIPDSIYVRDVENTFVLVNKAFLSSSNRKREEVVGKRDSDVFPPQVIKGFRLQDRAVLSTGQASDVEEAVTHHGEPKTYATSKFPIKDARGALVALGSISKDITARKEAEDALRESRMLLHAIIDNSPNVIFAKDLGGRYILANREAGRTIQTDVEHLIGKTDQDIFPAKIAEAIRTSDKRVIETGMIDEGEQVIEHPSGRRVYWSSRFPLRDAQGNIYATCGISVDITERERHETERARQQEEIIRLQQSVLRELSTPLIPIADQVVIMPLIGSLDRARAQQALEILLHGAMEHRARVAIIDITGVTQVNAEVADGLVRAARAVELLGAETVLTGIRPEVAQTFVNMGFDLRGIVTRGTLQSGIAYALGQRGRGIGGSR